jgi:tetratricopeptide (TPR) repeat protein
MNNDLETIENYLSGQLSDEARAQFETTLRTDPAVADALAFYVLARHTAKVDALGQRRDELDALYKRPRTAQETNHVPVPLPTSDRRLWSAPMRWVAAASVLLLLGLGWYFFRISNAPDAAQLADAYVTRTYDQLSTTMGSGAADKLTQGIGLYNERKFAEAESTFKALLTEQPDNDRTLKFAGLVALRQKKYDSAIDRFHQLSQRTDLVSNPGTFLEAIALLQRNRPMDKGQAKKLLEEVINKNLDGKNEATGLLEAL